MLWRITLAIPQPRAPQQGVVQTTRDGYCSHLAPSRCAFNYACGAANTAFHIQHPYSRGVEDAVEQSLSRGEVPDSANRQKVPRKSEATDNRDAIRPRWV